MVQRLVSGKAFHFKRWHGSVDVDHLLREYKIRGICLISRPLAAVAVAQLALCCHGDLSGPFYIGRVFRFFFFVSILRKLFVEHAQGAQRRRPSGLRLSQIDFCG